MGKCYEVVCHDCKVSWRPRFAKLCEIETSVKSLAEIGGFMLMHRHHRVELICDEKDDRCLDIDMSDYREMAWFEIQIDGI